MDFSNKPNKQHHDHHHLHHALNNLQTLFSNIIHRITNPHNNNTNNYPFCSISLSRRSSNSPMPRWRTKNKSMSTYEIKKRMAGIPVYKISNYSSDVCSTETNDGDIRLFYFSKQDAHDYLSDLQHDERTDPPLPTIDDWRVVDTPLSEVLEYKVGQPPIRLVPESLQLKNAIEETRKNMTGFPVDSFCGVPVFKSNCMSVSDPRTRKIYQPAYLRKEDLEHAMTALVGSKERHIIQVAALENIIQDMKDSSTSKSNDVLLIGPGMSVTWLCEH